MAFIIAEAVIDKKHLELMNELKLEELKRT